MKEALGLAGGERVLEIGAFEPLVSASKIIRIYSDIAPDE
jgi:hypothetical protein